MILDSGSRREFETGAVRDIAEGKGRCDLLPLDVVAKILGTTVLPYINDYIRYGPVSYTHLRAHETKANLVCRLLLEKKKKKL